MGAPELVLLAIPFAVYLSLCLLPAGRGALIGIGVAAGFCLLFWLANPAVAMLVLLVAAGVAFAALAQGLRVLLGARLTRGAYLALVLLPVLVLAVGWIAAAGA